MKLGKYAGWVALALVVTLAVSALALWFLNQRKRKAECAERGGHVVEVEATRGGWFCREVDW